MTKTTMPPLFARNSAPTGNEHPLYRACLEHSSKRSIADELRRIWETYGMMHPDDPEWFVGEFRRDFPARAWELYVLYWLVSSGATLAPRLRGRANSAAKGPDFCATHSNVGRFWIECVVATPGEGKNRVWQRTTETSWNGPPDEPLQLRYASSICDKIEKISKRYAGIIAPSEPVVLALSQGAIRDSDLNDLEFPLAMGMLYGVDGTVETVDADTGESKFTTRRRKVIQKPSGARVSSWIFGDAGSEVISGLMLTRVGIYELFTAPRPLMLMAHNPRALNGIPIGALPFRGEVWEDTGKRRLAHRGDVAEFDDSLFEAEFAADE